MNDNAFRWYVKGKTFFERTCLSKAIFGAIHPKGTGFALFAAESLF
jgi:hypothetical protein